MSSLRLLGIVALLLAPPDATRTFKESDAVVPNPERGFFAWRNFARDRDYAALFKKGDRVVHGVAKLDEFRDRALTPEFLAKLGEAFDSVRAAGLKVLLRFSYDSSRRGEDAPKARVLEHIAQLKPLLEAHEDVLVALEAGFVGAWGEGHSSKNGLATPDTRKELLRALLAALPKSRMVLVRTPGYYQEVFGTEPLPEADAYGGSDSARVGHHNDCFLADETDMGTYDPGSVEALKKFTEAWTRTCAMAGETCRLSPPRSDGRTALAELARFHWSMLHEGYHPAVLKSWKEQGVLEEIRRRLGYRFSLVEASWTPSVRPGGSLALSVKLRNSGFATPFNPRPVFAVLRGEKSKVVLAVTGEGTDPRRWTAGTESRFAVTLAIPAGAEPGTYRLALWLPDPAPALRDREEYAVRFANEDVWEGGENVLARDLKIEP